jgi:hypothetical protein
LRLKHRAPSVLLVLALISSTLAVGVAYAAPPSNDDIAEAIALTEGVEQRFSAFESTIEAGEATCDGDNTVWYSFTAAVAGDYVAYATGSDYDTEVGWFDDLTTQAGSCPDDANESYDAVDDALAFTAGQERFVSVGPNSTDYLGTGGVGVAKVEAADDDFADASALSFRDGTSTAVRAIGHAGTETAEAGEPASCGDATLDPGSAWLAFTPPTTGTWMLEAKSGADTWAIGVYSGTAVDDLSLLNCSHTSNGGHLATLAHLDAGPTYMILVTSSGSGETVIRAERAPARGVPTVVADAAGTSTGTIYSDLAILPNGQPAIAYWDGTDGALRYAERNAGGTWTDVLVDGDGDGASTDVGRFPSIAVIDGQPAIAYHDETDGSLRYAARSAGGTWSDQLVDDNGSGASTDVGENASLIARANGLPAIAYQDSTNQDLRYARQFAGGSWSDELVEDGTDVDHVSMALTADGPAIVYAQDPELRFLTGGSGAWVGSTILDDSELDGDGVYGASITVDSSGNPVVGASIYSAHHMLLWWNGTAWVTDRAIADRHRAELDFECAQPDVLVDADDTPMIVWTDCNYDSSMAVSVRDAEGNWEVHDVAPYVQDPGTTDWLGYHDTWNNWRFGAALLEDGRLAVSIGTDADDTLWYLEDGLVADAGGAYEGTAASEIALDGTASVDGWGDIVAVEWDVPELCSVAAQGSLETTVWCVGPASGDVTIHVVDSDGFTSVATTALEVSNAVCAGTEDPFTDVPANSFARDDITCIYDLGVTTGRDATTYDAVSDVTREQMAAFMARLYRAITGSAAPVVATPFTDISTSFARDDIARIYGLGVTTGRTATTYDPSATVDREEMAAFMARLYAAIRGDAAPVVATPFTDISTSFARDDIARIYGLGITLGRTATTYDPFAAVDREEMAAFLARLYQSD